MRINTEVRKLADTEELFLFGLGSDRCLMCVDTGSALFEALEDAAVGDRFGIEITSHPHDGSVQIEKVDFEDRDCWIGGERYGLTSGAVDVLEAIRTILGNPRCWISVERFA